MLTNISVGEVFDSSRIHKIKIKTIFWLQILYTILY